MTDDRDITERLECPSYDGAIFMRRDAAKEIRRLREYSSKQALDIVALGQEVGRLREALEKIAALDVPRPVVARYRADGKPSKYDRCAHTINMWDDCARCISDYARAARAEKEER